MSETMHETGSKKRMLELKDEPGDFYINFGVLICLIGNLLALAAVPCSVLGVDVGYHLVLSQEIRKGVFNYQFMRIDLILLELAVISSVGVGLIFIGKKKKKRLCKQPDGLSAGELGRVVGKLEFQKEKIMCGAERPKNLSANNLNDANDAVVLGETIEATGLLICCGGSLMALMFIPCSMLGINIGWFFGFSQDIVRGILNYQFVNTGLLLLELLIINGVGLGLFFIGRQKRKEKEGEK